MKQLTTQEILRIFALYINCPCAIYDYADGSTDWAPAEVEGIDLVAGRVIAERVSWPVSQIRLIVKPMEIYLTEEDKQQILQFIIDDDTVRRGGTIFQYKLSKHYDPQLWFGPDHWANGKTVFDLGLAIPDRSYLFELIKNIDGLEGMHKLVGYAKEINADIDTLEGMMKLIDLLKKMRK